MVAKEEWTIKMVDSSTCEVTGTRTVNITSRDGKLHALEAVRYVPKARYNLISIGVLNKKGYQIQVQQSIITISQRDGVILEGEKYEGYTS